MIMGWMGMVVRMKEESLNPDEIQKVELVGLMWDISIVSRMTQGLRPTEQWDGVSIAEVEQAVGQRIDLDLSWQPIFQGRR